MRHVRLRYLLIWEQRVTRSKLGVSRHQHWRHHWRLHSLVVVGVDADLHLLAGEGVLAQLQRLELMMRLKIRPAPDSTIDHVRQTFSVRHLELVKYLVMQSS